MDKHPIRKLLQEPGAKRFLKQQALAIELSIPEPILSDYLNSKRSPSEDFAIRLSEALGTPRDQTILVCEAARCEHQAKEARAKDELDSSRRYEVARDSLLETLETVRRFAPPSRVDSMGNVVTSLRHFPYLRDGPWCVIAGDRRESPPASRADLAALSMSSSDLMFLLGLKLPPSTLVRSDKIFRILSESEIGELLSCNILAIGSPAVSFATREILRRTGATHFFNISQDEYEKERALSDSIDEVARLDPEKLTAFANQADVAEKVSQFLPDFRKAGFVDPIDFRGIRGRAQGRGRDYGIVALAPNPWSEDHVVVVAAGVHGPGTAGALQMLAMPQEFAQRPWGGVIVVNTPPLAKWQHLFERHLHPRFETREYDPAKYISDLQTMIDGIRTPAAKDRSALKDVNISTETLRKTLAFAEQLAQPIKHDDASVGERLRNDQA
jgi:plasmid maintenance system antidote protein VapI